MSKKLSILFLAIFVCLVVFVSCFVVVNNTKNGNKDEANTTVKGPLETFPPETDVLEAGRGEAENNLEKNFSNQDLEGKNLTVVIADDVPLFMDAENETEYSRALQIQSELISEKLNCNLYINTISYANFLSDALAAKNAGLFYADVVCVPQKAIGYMRSRDMVSNLSELYGNVFTEEYFFADSKTASSGNNSQYCIANKSSITPASYGCVYFNKTISDACGVTDKIYESVENGSWTIDKMLEYAAICGAADGGLTSITGPDTSLIKALFASSGMKFINTGEGVAPTLVDNGDRLNGFVTKLQSLLDDGRLICGQGGIDIFSEGSALFYIDTLESCKTVKGMYGILPLPKFDETQEKYYGYSSENALVYAVLTTNNRPEYAPTLIKALGSTSQLVYDGYARDLLDYALRESKSYYTVKELFDNPNYDLTYMLGESYASVSESTYKALENAVIYKMSYADAVKKQSAQLSNDLAAIFP